MLPKRVTGLLFISPLVIALCLAAYKFGPTSSGKTAPTETIASFDSKPIATADTQQSHSKLFELFGMYENAVGKGRVKANASDFLDSIEALYRQRGYEKLETTNLTNLKKRKFVPHRNAKNVAPKFFQRQEEADGISTISATGLDADYNSTKPADKPFSFSTLVTQAEDGNIDWTTYRIEVDRTKLDQLSNLKNNDFPGSDPANVPRFEGLQRIYALNSERGSVAIYKSNEQQNSLLLRYLRDMPRYGWRLDDQATSDAGRAASGVMCFTRGQNMCLIWITPNKDTNGSNITISAY
jgi:hypothetical protein